jgi:ADP-heptose:LPS heptosyltransferase
LVRADGVGDALCLAPLICALLEAGHELGILLATRNAGIYARGVFSHVHVVERIPWPEHRSTPLTYARALAEARAVGYDVALVPSENPEGYEFARATGARRRIGFTNGWEKPFKSLWMRAELTRAVVRSASPWRVVEHEVETLFRLGAGLHDGAEPVRAVKRLRPLLAPALLDADVRVALQVSGSRADRTALDYVALARAIGAEFSTVIVAAASDAMLAGAVAAASGLEVLLFEDVQGWREQLVRMRAVVTADGGAAHLAGMAGVPCVDIFSITPYVARDVVRWRPWAGPSRTLIAGPEPSANARAAVQALRDLLEHHG